MKFYEKNNWLWLLLLGLVFIGIYYLDLEDFFNLPKFAYLVIGTIALIFSGFCCALSNTKISKIFMSLPIVIVIVLISYELMTIVI